MKYLHERLAMGGGLLVLPGLFLAFVLLPTQQKNREFRSTIEALNQEASPLPRFTPLSRAETQWLADSGQALRRRIPVVQGDRARLDHYTWVVSSLQDALQKAGVASPSMRSSWDPIRASFTLSGGLAESGSSASPLPDGPTLRLSGWVLEVQVPGETGNLFKALTVAAQTDPLLQPVGLRWEVGPEARRQHLLVRNLVLVPNTP